MPTDGNKTPALQVEGLTKDFGGQRALDHVDFELRGGEVHALLGENGAGKSTLIKLLAGVHRPDEGKIWVGGAELPAHHLPADAARQGLHFVHQDLGLVDDLSVAENIALEVGFARHRGIVDIRGTECRAAELLERQGLAIDPRRLVGELPQAEKVMVAIARAFFGDARAIVLDEVSASLPAPQVERLTNAVRRAREGGVGFIWVTHRLDELFGFADRVTVLRDGREVATAPMADVDRGQIVEWIIGRRLVGGRRHRSRGPTAGATGKRLEIRGLCGLGLPEPLSFSVEAGEILGLTGLIGCGAQEVARLLGGSPRVSGGEALLAGQPLPLGKARKMRERGVGYVPGDRAADGALPSLTVRENLFPVSIGHGSDDGFLRMPRKEHRAARQLIQSYGVKPEGSAEMPLDTLSGGNQQKVIFGRAMRTSPKVLILNDPATGVDVGARIEIYSLIHEAAANGAIVVLASSDHEEIVDHADRVLVMVAGRIGAELQGDEITRDELAGESYAVAASDGTRGAIA